MATVPSTDPVRRAAPSPRRRPTRTRSFGSGKRESHDASGFYRRFQAPVLSDDSDVRRPAATDVLFCGDAAKMTEDQVADRSVALVVTSPPYFAGKEYEEDLASGEVPKSYVEYLEKLYEVLAVCVDKLEPGGRMAINVANLGRKPYRSLSADVISILQDDLGLLLRGEIIWRKAKGAGGSCAWGSFRSPANPVLRDVTERVIVASKGRFDRALSAVGGRSWAPHEPTIGTEFLGPPSTSGRSHPSRRHGWAIRPFPVELPRRLIELWLHISRRPGARPFIGSGTTAVAAIETGRHYVGFDTDPSYIALAEERIARFRQEKGL